MMGYFWTSKAKNKMEWYAYVFIFRIVSLSRGLAAVVSGLTFKDSACTSSFLSSSEVCLLVFGQPAHVETEPGWCPNNSNRSQDTAKIHYPHSVTCRWIHGVKIALKACSRAPGSWGVHIVVMPVLLHYIKV